MTAPHARTRAKRYSPRQHNRQKDDRTIEPQTHHACLNCYEETEDPGNEFCDACTLAHLQR